MGTLVSLGGVMEAIACCNGCRGLSGLCNRAYIVPWLRCTPLLRPVHRSTNLLVLILVFSLLVFTVPTPTALVYSDLTSISTDDMSIAQAGLGPTFPTAVRVQNVAIAQIEHFLQKFKVDS